ncbi:MAG: hypothetical protein VX583_04160 [Bdellovibrionota bacterium]|nr:hypothetical protein [Pseudobdellovibrionaceae bacterium]|tara:strand:+ start:16444 stop:17085 length:642 start_codon:yes stop_codon:yes gene_type:complete
MSTDNWQRTILDAKLKLKQKDFDAAEALLLPATKSNNVSLQASAKRVLAELKGFQDDMRSALEILMSLPSEELEVSDFVKQLELCRKLNDDKVLNEVLAEFEQYTKTTLKDDHQKISTAFAILEEHIRLGNVEKSKDYFESLTEKYRDLGVYDNHFVSTRGYPFLYSFLLLAKSYFDAFSLQDFKPWLDQFSSSLDDFGKTELASFVKNELKD